MSEETTQNLPNDDLRLILARLDSIDTRLGSIDTRLTTLEGKVDSIDTRLTTLEEKVDRRLMETRPIWEQVLARLDSLETGLDNLKDEMQSGFRRIERQVRLLAEDVLEVRADQRDLEKRMDKLEPEASQ